VPATPAVERVGMLPNGLRVIVREKHVGGIAAFRIYLRAGSLNEGDYAGTGISHLLEHVLSGGATPTRTEDRSATPSPPSAPTPTPTPPSSTSATTAR